jgi:hypothetical protein
MSTQRERRHALRGRVRRRLLLNAVVDPGEAADRLPPGLRPHVFEEGTVVGCCLLDVAHVRPAGLPAIAGRRLRAAAHRISAEWEDASGATVVGVYVPMRHTDARAAVAAGGRLFPGVHERASVDIVSSDAHLSWSSRPTRDPHGLGVRVAVTVPADAPTAQSDDAVAATCLAATIGISPDHNGLLEAARMELADRSAVAVTIDDLDSAFMRSFATARLTTSFLMRGAPVTWTRADAPAGLTAVRR